jgi:hypothetical protein
MALFIGEAQRFFSRSLAAAFFSFAQPRLESNLSPESIEKVAVKHGRESS